MKTITLLTSLATLGMASACFGAQVIYSDDFSGGSVALNGTAPDTRPGSQTWSASTGTANTFQWNASGTLNSPTANEYISNAFLPFTVESNKVYELSVKLTLTTSTNAYIAMGFSQLAPVTSAVAAPFTTSSAFGNTAVNAAPWVMMRSSSNTSNANQVVTRMGPSLTTPTNYTGTAGAHDFMLRLDTTTALWSVSYFRDGVQLGTTTSYTANPTIGFVGFGMMFNTGSGIPAATVDNFQLTVVPEASPWLLLTGGLTVLFAFHRRRKV